MHKGLRPNSRILVQILIEHYDQVAWTNWHWSKEKNVVAGAGAGAGAVAVAGRRSRFWRKVPEGSGEFRRVLV